ncbi:MAG: hypothetical protein HY868_18340 [Chloroflexi bacterium]|nr:hypothetical protein [Chloroflexota bacterium]
MFPLLLLLSTNTIFYVDWYNHLWQVGYYGKYWAVHGTFPVTLNTDDRLLVAFPTFYGYLFYPVLGIISSLTGPNLAIRLAVLLLWVVKFWLVYKLTFQISKDSGIGMVLACLTSWEIYPLTNLYNRSALTELFATGLVTCSLCSFMLMLMEKSIAKEIFYLLITGVELSLALASHPITALYAIPFFGALLLATILVAFYYRYKELARSVISGTLLCIFVVLVMLPWLYATIIFSKSMRISSSAWQISPIDSGMAIFPDDIDHVFTRFAFFPYDRRSQLRGISEVSTPFLDAQVDMPLLIFCVTLILFVLGKENTNQEGMLRRAFGRALLGVSLIMFCFATFLSLSDLPYRYLPAFVRLIQFPYRLVTCQNLMLFVAALSLLLISQHRFRTKSIRLVVVTICITLGAVGVCVKLSHGFAIVQSAFPWQSYNRNWSDEASYLSLPPTFYGRDDYTFQSASQLPDDFLPLGLPLGQGKDFGRPLPITIYLSESTWMQTNIAASPWNSYNGPKNSDTKVGKIRW